MKKFIFYISILLFINTASAAAINLTYQVLGISGEPLTNANASLKTLQHTVAKTITTQTVQQFYVKAPEALSDAVQPYGYFHASVSKQLHQQAKEYTAIFRVQLGAVNRIKQSSIKITGEGSNNLALRKILQKAKSALAAGKTLNTVIYENIKQDFFAAAENAGYIRAAFSEHRILVDTKTNTSVILLTFDTGPRFYFGNIYFSPTPLSNNFLSRYLPFQPGQAFSSQQLLTGRANLSNTIYFNRVTVTPDLKKTNNQQVPIDVTLVPAPRQKYSLGAGFGTDTGLRANAGWQVLYLSPGGNYFQTAMQLTEKDNDNLQARYVIPGKNPMTDSYALTAGIFTNKPGENNDRYTTEQIGANYITMLEDWQQTVFLQFQHEDFTVNQIDGRANTILPGIGWQKFSTQNRINVDNGYRMNINLQGGAVTNMMNASFLQSEFQGKYIRSFSGEKNRVILQTDIGATYVSNFADMPLSQRFFAGGAQLMRGYDYQQIGPGRYLAVGSIEWQRQIRGKIYGALFYNAGNAIENTPFDVAEAAGFGVLFRSPIGPIELTLAQPFHVPYGVNQHGWQIQFNMGPDL